MGITSFPWQSIVVDCQAISKWRSAPQQAGLAQQHPQPAARPRAGHQHPQAAPNRSTHLLFKVVIHKLIVALVNVIQPAGRVEERQAARVLGSKAHVPRRRGRRSARRLKPAPCTEVRQRMCMLL